MFDLFGSVFMLVFLAIGLVSLVVWIWGLIDLLGNKSLTDNERIVWVLVVIFLQALGAIIYFLMAPRGSRRPLS